MRDRTAFGKWRRAADEKPQIPAEKIEEIINATLQTRPPGATHWSCRTMAEEQGVSKATVNRIWQSHVFSHTGQSRSSCRGIPGFWRN